MTANSYLFNCISNTLQLLNENDLLYFHQKPIILKNKDASQITWPNHKSGRHNTDTFWGKIYQYKSILNDCSYNGLLNDGSIIKVSYTIDKSNFLSNHNLWYWPSPFPFDRNDLEEFTFLDIIELYESDPNFAEYLLMRSPMRFDFSDKDANQNHPATHIHIQHKHCRIYVKHPVCFNKFIKFIYQNLYPELYIKHNFWDELENSLTMTKFPDLEDFSDNYDFFIQNIN